MSSNESTRSDINQDNYQRKWLQGGLDRLRSVVASRLRSGQQSASSKFGFQTVKRSHTVSILAECCSAIADGVRLGRTPSQTADLAPAVLLQKSSLRMTISPSVPLSVIPERRFSPKETLFAGYLEPDLHPRCNLLTEIYPLSVLDLLPKLPDLKRCRR